MKQLLKLSFVALIAWAGLSITACKQEADTTELFGDCAPEVGFMTTTKAELVQELGTPPVSSGTRIFYEKKSNYTNGADETKPMTAEIVRYDGQTNYEAYRIYVMLNEKLVATAIVFNTNQPSFVSILNNYLSRYFRIDFEYILRVGGMDVEPADLDQAHQYLLDMFNADMYLSKKQPESDPDTFDQWLNSVIGYTMIIRSSFPYREGTGDYSLLVYLDVNSIIELAKIYDRLGFVDFVLEQVPS